MGPSPKCGSSVGDSLLCYSEWNKWATNQSILHFFTLIFNKKNQHTIDHLCQANKMSGRTTTIHQLEVELRFNAFQNFTSPNCHLVETSPLGATIRKGERSPVRLHNRRHDMETFSALKALCEAIHRSPVDFPHKRPITMFPLMLVHASCYIWALWRSFDGHCNERKLMVPHCVLWPF